MAATGTHTLKSMATSVSQEKGSMETRLTVLEAMVNENRASLKELEAVMKKFLQSSTEVEKQPMVEIQRINTADTQQMQSLAQNRGLKVEVPRFDGSNVEDWIFKIEEYFVLFMVAANQQIRMASKQLDGPAFAWYTWMMKNNMVSNWNEFRRAALLRFGTSMNVDHRREFKDVQQKTTVEAYQTEFETVSTRSSSESGDETECDDYSRVFSISEMNKLNATSTLYNIDFEGSGTNCFDENLQDYCVHDGNKIKGKTIEIPYADEDANSIPIDEDINSIPTATLLEMSTKGIKKAVEELNPIRRAVFGMLYKHKLSWMNKGYKQKNASPLADLLAFRKVKARLGGRVRLIISGGAPLGSEVEEFLRVTSCAFVCQGYGLTETCGATTMGFPDEMCMVGTVGAISVYNEVRLEEVSDMGYDPLGSPPSGEVCIRGKTVFTGYHKNPELTREAIKDGWFHTGDIGEVHPNGVIKIIDRRKNLIKLSQGEYIALEHLENVYGITPIVEDIWVCGNSFKSVLVAVVVPNEENAKKWAYSNGHGLPFSELCSLDQLKKYVLTELNSTAERNKLKGFERIKGVILEPLPFDMERDLVTATLKKRRNNLLKYYQGKIDELYLSFGAK